MHYFQPNYERKLALFAYFNENSLFFVTKSTHAQSLALLMRYKATWKKLKAY